jgi:hypothetical protein
MLKRMSRADEIAERVSHQIGLAIDIEFADGEDVTEVVMTANGQTIYIGRLGAATDALLLVETMLQLSDDYAGDDPF